MRGVAVLAMCFDHFMFDCSHPWAFFSNFFDVENSFADKLYGFARWYWESSGNYISGFRFWGHAVFIFLFLFIVGTSCAFSRSNVRRGALCGVAAFLFTAISFVCKAMGFMQDGIIFGILDCIAMSILIVTALDRLTEWNKYVNLYAPLVVGIVISAVAISQKAWLPVPRDATFTDAHFLGYIFGTHAFGDDWFGLFPYTGFVFLGMYWGKAAYPTRMSLLPKLDGKWNKPFTFVGRHALIVYFVHQVVIAGLIMAVGMCMGYKVG